MLLGMFAALSLILLGLSVTGFVLGGYAMMVPYAAIVICSGIASAAGISIGAGIGVFAALIVATMALAGGISVLVGGFCHLKSSKSKKLNMEPGQPTIEDVPPPYIPGNHFQEYDPFRNPVLNRAEQYPQAFPACNHLEARL